MIAQVLKQRGDKYGSFHTHANLTQTLEKIILQHYAQTHANEEGKYRPMPEFMLEAIHMICHKLARIANGDPMYDDSWVDISGYATLVVDILKENQAAQEASEKTNTATSVKESE